jgi:HEAT repeat protein
MNCRRTVAGVLFCATVVATQVLAQTSPVDPRERLRNSQQRPQQQQQFDDSLRKFTSDDVSTRLEGIREMGTMRDEPRAIDYLLEAANDPNPTIRVKAIDTLGDMQAKAAVPALVQRIQMSDTDLPTERRILACLGRIGDKQATEPLLDIIERDDLSIDLKASAVYALGEIGDDAALPTLEALAAGDVDDPLRPVAKAAVSMIHNRPAPTVVPPALAPRRPGPGGPAGS